MGSFSLAHWLIVLVIVLIIFGPNKLGQIGQGLGEGIRNFKKGLNGEDEAGNQKQLSSSDKKDEHKS